MQNRLRITLYWVVLALLSGCAVPQHDASSGGSSIFREQESTFGTYGAVHER